VVQAPGEAAQVSRTSVRVLEQAPGPGRVGLPNVDHEGQLGVAQGAPQTVTLTADLGLGPVGPPPCLVGQLPLAIGLDGFALGPPLLPLGLLFQPQGPFFLLLGPTALFVELAVEMQGHQSHGRQHG
jgi:hypothetical protein